jgi:uncharacterized protein (DUF924 family)
MTIEPPLHEEVVAFWREAGRKRWFAKDDGFDAEIRQRFEALGLAAARAELTDWAETAEGALALILLLDQFPRNLYRGSAHAFAADPMARMVADGALAAGFDQALEPELRPFLYLPFEHSEALADQDRAVLLNRERGSADDLKWAMIHRDIIRRFGRFPHRNAVLGRTSTVEELAFRAEGGFSG